MPSGQSKAQCGKDKVTLRRGQVKLLAGGPNPRGVSRKGAKKTQRHKANQWLFFAALCLPLAPLRETFIPIFRARRGFRWRVRRALYHDAPLYSSPRPQRRSYLPPDGPTGPARPNHPPECSYKPPARTYLFANYGGKTPLTLPRASASKP